MKKRKKKKKQYQRPYTTFESLMVGQANDEFYKKYRKDKKQTKSKKKVKPKRSYKEYLKSDTWKIKRDKVIKRAKNKCEVCNTNRAWQVHHITYKRIFRERLSDLVATCETCHKAEHNLLTEEEVEMAVLELSKSEGYR